MRVCVHMLQLFVVVAFSSIESVHLILLCLSVLVASRVGQGTGQVSFHCYCNKEDEEGGAVLV